MCALEHEIDDKETGIQGLRDSAKRREGDLCLKVECLEKTVSGLSGKYAERAAAILDLEAQAVHRKRDLTTLRKERKMLHMEATKTSIFHQVWIRVGSELTGRLSWWTYDAT